MLDVRDLVLVTSHRFGIGPLSLSASPGQKVLIQGANGSGKTTLLRALAGLQKISSGHVRWGRVHCHRSWVSHIFPPVAHARTVKHYQRYWHHVLSIQHPALVLADAWMTCDLHHLSAGQQRFVHLASLLDRGADVWMLDEPTSYLDDEHQNLLFDACRSFSERGGLIFMSSHDQVRSHFWDMRVVL